MIVNDMIVGNEELFFNLCMWKAFCSQRGEDPLHPPVEVIISFLTKLYNDGAKYRTICQARSALNSIITLSGYTYLSQHTLTLITRFIKGVFNIRPPLPTTKFTWNIQMVLDYINNETK